MMLLQDINAISSNRSADGCQSSTKYETEGKILRTLNAKVKRFLGCPRYIPSLLNLMY